MVKDMKGGEVEKQWKLHYEQVKGAAEAARYNLSLMRMAWSEIHKTSTAERQRPEGRGV